ncbi:hypothetical protein KIH27_18560 [Mycobacterium sp. M1]|uniref:Uncharacterized protein n=1 Tax=Mycolicibacter acidiphilus TaxID=2835306 RepID=A0ABS5RMQ3_9MYCO|nr:hypothetical protein [Mycolicibacter acidiphilus]MBS9535592.1 hypothetical protein [Mycolicibacter acidiphilus]
MSSNPLKTLLLERHLHAYSDFVVEYTRMAKGLDLPHQAPAPTKSQYYRWVAGDLQTLPRGHHCAVLERMFPGWTARELFGLAGPPAAEPLLHDRSQAPDPPAVLTGFGPAVDPTALAGLWVTCFTVEVTRHHADLSTITVTNGVVTAKNYPPDPRTEGQTHGYKNHIHARVFGRHLIGQWRNVNDSYYYGAVHFAVLPGETVLDGYYTGFVNDTQVVAERWRWVRVDPQSTTGIDLDDVKLGQPRRLYDCIMRRSNLDGPITLADLH